MAHEAARRRGGTIAVGVMATGLGVVTLVWTIQIFTQAWAMDPTADSSCRAGVRSLVTAVRRARGAAGSVTSGERAALARFRAGLLPEWSQDAALSATCRSDPAAERLLREVRLLRYAEERSVRYESRDVARRRRRVQALEAAITPSPQSSGLANQPPAN